MEMERNKKLILNTLSSFTNQIVTVICGFIVPRLILNHYGSCVNGLIGSISQFLGIVTFLELGMGSVVQSALYSPLANNNSEKISAVYCSGFKFFKKIAYILLLYVFVLACFYPCFVSPKFGWIYTSTLIIAMSISSFVQYYFGLMDQLLLNADQRGYVHYFTQSITIILNAIVSYLLIYLNFPIQLVKLMTSIIYIIRPFVLRTYVNNHYKINRNISYIKEPISQKWNGLSQHIAAVVLDGTDSIVLSLFSTLENVSIYSVYHLVISGIKQLFMSLTNGLQSLIGEMWAKDDKKELKTMFEYMEWFIHFLTNFIFGCTIVLIVPFVKVYTLGINDADYIQFNFAFLLVIANAMHCYRLPYNMMVLAAGHYKQTQNNYIIVALINIIVSIIAVKKFGLVGVAIGTLIALTYQTLWLSFYNSKNLIKCQFKKTLKLFAIDALSIFLLICLCTSINMNVSTFCSWALKGFFVSIINITLLIIINIFFYKKNICHFINSLKKHIKI